MRINAEFKIFNINLASKNGLIDDETLNKQKLIKISSFFNDPVDELCSSKLLKFCLFLTRQSSYLPLVLAAHLFWWCLVLTCWFRMLRFILPVICRLSTSWLWNRLSYLFFMVVFLLFSVQTDFYFTGLNVQNWSGEIFLTGTI